MEDSSDGGNISDRYFNVSSMDWCQCVGPDLEMPMSERSVRLSDLSLIKCFMESCGGRSGDILANSPSAEPYTSFEYSFRRSSVDARGVRCST